ncbi:MAG: helix-turn-helix transcriptional regulator [Candidatus Omnitrophica bacterium]|nr:helix-turn-helix transcriptional regulator [Candidatus Omnitrophota bacterium]
MIKDVLEDGKVKNEALQEINKKSLAKFLFYLRCEHGLTQTELANRIGCTQSRISKIENSYNYEISVQDLLDYGQATNLKLELGYRNKDARLVDLIAFHVQRIQECVHKLTDCSKGDKSMCEGAVKVIVGMVNQLIGIVQESFAKLDVVQKRKVRDSREEIHLSLPIKNKVAEAHKMVEV